MLKLIAIFSLLVISFSAKSQIKFEKVETEIKENKIIYYDSTSNKITRQNIWSIKGQTLFALGSKDTYKRKSRFSLQTKLKNTDYSENITYFQIKNDILPYSEYDSIVGYYFIVKDIVEYKDHVYIKLIDKERQNYVYYKYSKYDFPFLILGFYEKEKRKIGKKFKITRKETYLENAITKKKERIDTKEKLAISKIVIDTESFELYYFFEDFEGGSYKLESSTYDFLNDNSFIIKK